VLSLLEILDPGLRCEPKLGMLKAMLSSLVTQGQVMRQTHSHSSLEFDAIFLSQVMQEGPFSKARLMSTLRRLKDLHLAYAKHISAA